MSEQINDKPFLYIDSSFIYGNKNGLLALRKAIDDCLADKLDPDDFTRCTVYHAEDVQTNYCVRQDWADDIMEIIENG